MTHNQTELQTRRNIEDLTYEIQYLMQQELVARHSGDYLTEESAGRICSTKENLLDEQRAILATF